MIPINLFIFYTICLVTIVMGVKHEMIRPEIGFTNGGTNLSRFYQCLRVDLCSITFNWHFTAMGAGLLIPLFINSRPFGQR